MPSGAAGHLLDGDEGHGERDHGSSCRVRNVAMGNTCLVTTGCLWPIPLVESFDKNVLARRPDLILVGVGRNDLCHQKTRDLLAGYKDLRAPGLEWRTSRSLHHHHACWPRLAAAVRGAARRGQHVAATLDGTIDFESRASTPHGLLLSIFDYGDGLHITARGYAALGRLAARAVVPQVAHLKATRS